MSPSQLAFLNYGRLVAATVAEDDGRPQFHEDDGVTYLVVRACARPTRERLIFFPK